MNKSKGKCCALTCIWKHLHKPFRIIFSVYHMGRNLGQYLAFLGRGPCYLWPCTCPWVVEIKRMVMTFNQQAAFWHLFNKDTSCTAQNPFNLESPQHMSLARTRLGVGSQIYSISNTEQNGVSYVYFFLYRHSNRLMSLSFPTFPPFLSNKTTIVIMTPRLHTSQSNRISQGKWRQDEITGWR